MKSEIWKKVKWWEWSFLVLGWCLMLTLGLVFKSSALIIFNSILGITGSFLIAKGFWFGYVVATAQLCVYCVLAYFNRYYGEIITCAIFEVPAYTLSIISWVKHKGKDHIVKVNKISWCELALAMLVVACTGVGVFYLLKVLNTASIVLNTLSLLSVMMYGYLEIRRSGLMFVFRLFCDVVSFLLWLLLILKNHDLSYVPTVVNYCIYFTCNLYGLFNFMLLWRNQKQSQNKENENGIS